MDPDQSETEDDVDDDQDDVEREGPTLRTHGVVPEPDDLRKIYDVDEDRVEEYYQFRQARETQKARKSIERTQQRYAFYARVLAYLLLIAIAAKGAESYANQLFGGARL